MHLGTRSRFFSSSIWRYMASLSKDMVALCTISAPRTNVDDDDIVFDPKNTLMETFLHPKNHPSLWGLGVVGESRRKFGESRRKFGKSRRSPKPFFCVFFWVIKKNNNWQRQIALKLTAIKPSNFFIRVGSILLWEPANKLFFSREDLLEFIGHK